MFNTKRIFKIYANEIAKPLLNKASSFFILQAYIVTTENVRAWKISLQCPDLNA